MSLAIRPLPRAKVDRWRIEDGRPTTPPDTRLERFIKLLPSDVFAIYIPVLGLGTLTGWPHYAHVTVACATSLVPLLLYLDARAAGDRVPSMQYVVRTFTFLAWAFVITPSVAPVEPPIAAIIAIAVPVIGEHVVRIQQRPW